MLVPIVAFVSITILDETQAAGIRECDGLPISRISRPSEAIVCAILRCVGAIEYSRVSGLDDLANYFEFLLLVESQEKIGPNVLPNSLPATFVRSQYIFESKCIRTTNNKVTMPLKSFANPEAQSHEAISKRLVTIEVDQYLSF